MYKKQFAIFLLSLFLIHCVGNKTFTSKTYSGDIIKLNSIAYTPIETSEKKVAKKAREIGEELRIALMFNTGVQKLKVINIPDSLLEDVTFTIGKRTLDVFRVPQKEKLTIDGFCPDVILFCKDFTIEKETNRMMKPGTMSTSVPKAIKSSTNFLFWDNFNAAPVCYGNTNAKAEIRFFDTEEAYAKSFRNLWNTILQNSPFKWGLSTM